MRAFFNKFGNSPFNIGDTVQFVPDDRTLGWLQDTHGLYYGYVGKVTGLERDPFPFIWWVYVDNKPIAFESHRFQLVKKA